jgi:hypothetical protein
MSRKLVAAVAFAVAATALSADDKKTDKPADWSKFAAAGTVVGEVVSADDAGFTLRISWKTPGSGGLRGRSRGRAVQGKEQHEDFELKYADGGLARLKALPVRIDEKGKKLPPTAAEKEARRKPAGVPGYSLDRTDLTPGMIAEVTLVRSRDVPASKATADDLVVKYAMVIGESPVPPKVDRDAKKKMEEKKKEKEKEKKN